ncbi:MAG: type IV pilus secretin PilQ [Deltaproteobacteria bacterium]|nr:type IV pilus secretin PilQ [Deltaproteobacteria bacterium]
MSIQKIEVAETLPGFRVIIEASQSFEYSVTKMTQPLRLMIDLPQVQGGNFIDPIVVQNGVINTIRHKKNADLKKSGTRVEIGLDQLVEYSVNSDGNRLYVELGKPIAAAAPVKTAFVSPAERPAVAQAKEKAPAVRLKGKKEKEAAGKKSLPVARSLKEITIAANPDGVEVNLLGDGSIPEYKSFQLTKPPRLVLDLPKMSNASSKKNIDVGSNYLKDIRIGKHPDKIRLVFNFPGEKVSPYQMAKEGQGLKILIGPQVKAVKEAKAPPAEARQPVRLAQVETPVKTEPPAAAAPPPAEKPAEPSKEVAIKEAATPAASSLATPEKEVPAASKGNEGDRLAMSQYKGARLSLDFKDADIHNIFRLIAEVSNLNVITSEDVKGKITIRLVNVPWDQALDVILTTKNLIKIEEGNVLRITTNESVRKERDERQKEEESLVKTRDTKLKLEEPGRRVVKVNYADAIDLQRMLLERAQEGKGLVSSIGTVKADKRTNSLIIQDVRSSIEEIEQLIKELDTPTPQVLIEARVVQASTTFARALGVQWGGSYNQTPGGRWFYGLTGNNPSAAAGWGFSPSATAGASTPLITPSNFVVNFPASTANTPAGGFGISFGKLTGSLINLDLRLQLGETNGQTKVIARPKLATLDNKEALIKQGEKIPYETTSQAGTQVQFIDAVLSLKVTPHVTPDGSILMKILVTRDARGAFRSPVNQVPSIDNREAQTEVLVKDGDTLVIGGIYQAENTETTQGLPWLMNIPILGWLFKNQETFVKKDELLIFITPTIIIQQKAEL